MGERVVLFNIAILADMVVTGWRAGYPNEVIECVEGIPANAVYTGRHWMEPSVGGDGVLVMVFEHPDWPALSPEQNNQLSIVFQRKTTEAQP